MSTACQLYIRSLYIMPAITLCGKNDCYFTITWNIKHRHLYTDCIQIGPFKKGGEIVFRCFEGCGVGCFCFTCIKLQLV